jgi:hypothetical protein
MKKNLATLPSDNRALSNAASHQDVSSVPEREQDVGHELLVASPPRLRIVVHVVRVRDQQRRPATTTTNQRPKVRVRPDAGSQNWSFGY